MTITLGSRNSKEEAIDLLRRLLQHVLFQHLTIPQREDMVTHLAWMRDQKPDLQVNCRVETVPELQLTRVTLEFAHQVIPEVRQ